MLKSFFGDTFELRKIKVIEHLFWGSTENSVVLMQKKSANY
jgi:hypothetical protein